VGPVEDGGCSHFTITDAERASEACGGLELTYSTAFLISALTLRHTISRRDALATLL
jgi:hypothetical protein